MRKALSISLPSAGVDPPHGSAEQDDGLVMEDPADLGVGLAGRSPRIGTLEQDAELVTGQDLVPEQCREIPPGARPITLDEFVGKIGRASCRERVCQYV